jgi:hypothetical protein
MVREPEALGCTYTTSFSRETSEYHLSGLSTPSVVETIVHNLSAAVDPLMDEWEFDMISHDYVSPEITRLQVHFAFHFYI